MTALGNITIRAASAIGCALLLGVAGCTNNPQTASMTGAPTKSVCLQTYQIDHTEIPDDSTILFRMKGGQVWKNTLTAPCSGLRANGGFQYSTDINEICSNLQSIRVIEQGGGPRLGAVCLLGEFTPYTPPPKANAGG
jgi:hypothetical protein